MPDDHRDGGIVAIPGFAVGGRVDRTGIALIHEGEYIVPAPGSEAQITADAGAGAATVVNYYFPVEIEVIGRLSDDQMQQLADYVYRDLDTAFGGQNT
jgi:hypothetical protein